MKHEPAPQSKKPDWHYCYHKGHAYIKLFELNTKISKKIVLGCKNCDFLREIGTP